VSSVSAGSGSVDRRQWIVDQGLTDKNRLVSFSEIYLEFIRDTFQVLKSDLELM
jgi:hypothetical protein